MAPHPKSRKQHKEKEKAHFELSRSIHKIKEIHFLKFFCDNDNRKKDLFTFQR